MSRRAQNSCVRSVAMGSPVSFYCQRTVYHIFRKLRIAGGFAGGLCGEILRPIFCAGGSAAGAAPGRLRGAILCHTTRRLAQTEGPYGLSTGVKQIAHFQNNNLSTFKIQCVQALHSSNCFLELCKRRRTVQALHSCFLHDVQSKKSMCAR